MRGGISNLMSTPTDAVAETAGYTATMPSYVTAEGDSMDNTENNLKYAINPGSLYWLLLITLLYGFWGWYEDKDVKESFKIGELKINLSNMVKITLGVVIGFNLINVFLTKLCAMKIPFVSRLAGTFLPLFSI